MARRGQPRSDRSFQDKGWLDKVRALPESYFKNDAKGNPCLDTKFVSKEVMDPFAEILSHKATPPLTTRQIRRFFNHCRDIERRLINNESWEQVARRFTSLSSSVAKNPNIPREFQQFMNDNIKRVKSSDNQGAAFLNGFMPHFEALVGFGSKYMRDR